MNHSETERFKVIVLGTVGLLAYIGLQVYGMIEIVSEQNEIKYEKRK